MRSIKARFRRCQKEQPAMSDFLCFSTAIRGQCFSEDTINRNFNRLVDKEDYDKKDKKDLMRQLYELARTPARKKRTLEEIYKSKNRPAAMQVRHLH